MGEFSTVPTEEEELENWDYWHPAEQELPTWATGGREAASGSVDASTSFWSWLTADDGADASGQRKTCDDRSAPVSAWELDPRNPDHVEMNPGATPWRTDADPSGQRQYCQDGSQPRSAWGRDPRNPDYHPYAD